MWITAQELISVPNMPKTVQGISYKAKNENWEKRKAKGIKGGAYEYNINSLSLPDRIRVLNVKNKIVIGNTIIDKPTKSNKSYCSKLLWSRVEKATNKQKEKAQKRVESVIAVNALVNSGIDVLTAFDTVASSHECSIPALIK